MRILYISLSCFFVLLGLASYYNFRRKRINFRDFLIWTVSFTFLAVISLFPGSLDILIQLLGIQFRWNFVLLVLLIITVSFIFVQFNTNRRLKSEINRLTQGIGQNSLYLNHPERIENRKKILVKMSAFNEEKNIGTVLDRIPEDMDVLVVDDGSDDLTAEVARSRGAMVIRHQINMGQGVGDLTGFNAAFDLGYEYVIEMDADGQHRPEDIPVFVNELENNPGCDFITGSRVIGTQQGAACNVRKTFLPVYTKIINWASGYQLTDAMCGFKAYKTASIRKYRKLLDELVETEYIAAEMLIKFGSAGLRVKEVPVTIKERESGKSRKGTFRYGFAVAWIILRTVLKKDRNKIRNES